MSTGATKNKLNAVAFVYEVARVPTAADIERQKNPPVLHGLPWQGDNTEQAQ